MIKDKPHIEDIFRTHGFNEFRWINPEHDIIVSNWVRMKCTYACASFNTKATCPPNVPGVDMCRNFFNEYNTGVLFHMSRKLEDPDDRESYSKEVNPRLLQIERATFLQGYHKSFVLFMDECRICAECTRRLDYCKDKKNSRPCPEAFAVDVFATARRQGLPIEVLKNYDEEMNRYAILLIE